MPYLVIQDFNRMIQSDNLAQIISGDSSILTTAILTATEEAASYLSQKYDLAAELQDTLTYDPTVAYKPGQRVMDSNGKIYSAIFPAQQFDYQGVYNVGDQVYWKGIVYTAVVSTPVLGHGSALQYGTYEQLPPYPAPDDVNRGAQYWGAGTVWTIPVATPLTNTTYFALGDTRSQMLVTYLVDMALYHLHSRIAPRNIPDLRVKRYDDAKRHLDRYAKGEITAAFPIIQPRQGMRIRWGGSIRNVNQY
jgi:phage gp36-like protein